MLPMILNELRILSGGASYAYNYAIFPFILDELKHAAKIHYQICLKTVG